MNDTSNNNNNLADPAVTAAETSTLPTTNVDITDSAPETAAAADNASDSKKGHVNWSDEEDLKLVNAWLDTFKDSKRGADQKRLDLLEKRHREVRNQRQQPQQRFEGSQESLDPDLGLLRKTGGLPVVAKKKDEASDPAEDAERPVGQEKAKAASLAKKQRFNDDDAEKQEREKKREERAVKQTAAMEKNAVAAEEVIRLQKDIIRRKWFAMKQAAIMKTYEQEEDE
ncbi:hypothetical protein BDB00DRAFT_870041 [Zychaea mexicana]|uniref:uncharacterized protein n=1 Tax=Zychaea mexicana TaxID=64656 RepID=UPI0022FDB874|nr:uncharacterized protein BDB00DRAFT_870041 [Zychaea mexicana]KAI9495816.1 hypothetical protein BDB00DRAFT_870041 [Zychaea mexicana]